MKNKTIKKELTNETENARYFDQTILYSNVKDFSFLEHELIIEGFKDKVNNINLILKKI